MALDSHLDVFLGCKDVIKSMPRQIRLAAGRASAHTLIRRVLGDLPIMLRMKELPTDFIPQMILVVPRITLNHHILEYVAPYTTSTYMSKQLESFLNHLTNNWGIKVFTSPPKNLLKLVDLLRKAEYPILDLDVDYLQEMQTECYTPIEYAQPGQLGWTARTLRLIRKVKPPVITISEAKVAATQSLASNFSKFIGRLQKWGYEIEYNTEFSNDADAERLIGIYQKFFEGVQKPLERKHMIGRGSLNSTYFKELKEATKQYFRHMKLAKS